MGNGRTPLTRREFLVGGASLPLVAWAAGESAPTRSANQSTSAASTAEAAAARRATDVLNVAEFEPLARAALPPAHYGFLSTGVDDDRTMRRNEEAFGEYQIRSHRFIDLTHLDTTVQVFGARWPAPVYLSAVSSMGAFHPQGELAVARAAQARSAQIMLSSGASMSLEQVMAERRAPVWQQLYPTDDWTVTEAIVHRAEAAGADAIVLTVDGTATLAVRNSETLRRLTRLDTRTCTNCHAGNRHDMWLRAPLFAGLDVSRVSGLVPLDLTIDWLDRLRHLVRGRLLVKGIVTGEDAALAVAHGVDGVVVSNHGGRNEETLRASIDCVAEVVAAVQNRVPVLVDGGIRRGTDVYKALALGATAVGVGRPPCWGLAAFGQEGVEVVLDIYARELKAIMMQAGTPTIASITPRALARHGTAEDLDCF
jgi:4-hydroxymandelate oxidase